MKLILLFPFVCVSVLAQTFLLTDLAFIDRSKRLPRTGLVAEYTFLEGSGQTVYNRTQTVQAQRNLVAAPESLALTTFWLRTGIAAASDAAAVAPNGATVASRISANAGANSVRQGSIVTANAAHTFSVWAKRNAGTDQTFRLRLFTGSVDHYSPDFTATDTWTRFSYTFTPTAGSNRFIYIITDSSNNAFDCLFWGLQLEQASSATDYLEQVFQQQLGSTQFSDSADPAWTSTNLYTQGSKYSFGYSSNPVSMTNSTVYAVCRWSGTPVLAGQVPILYTEAVTRLIVLAGAEGGTNNQVHFRFNNNAHRAELANLNDGAWHVVAVSYDGSVVTMFVDNSKVLQKTVGSLGTISLRNLYVSYNNGTAFWPGDIAFLSVYSTAHTATELKRNAEILQSQMSLKGNTPSFRNTFVMFEGDSNTDITVTVVPNNYTFRTVRSFSPPRQGYDIAASGDDFADWTARAATTDSFIYPGRTNVLVMLEGNSLLSLGTNAWFSALQSYCSARRAAGWKLVVQTLLPRTTGGFNTARNTANAMIRADPSFYDALCDGGADSTFGTDAAASDTTYYSDGVHMTAATHALLAPLVKAAIDSIP